LANLEKAAQSDEVLYKQYEELDRNIIYAKGVQAAMLMSINADR